MFGINNNRKEQELVRTMILEEKIRLYPFKDVYRVYGDTFENRAALKKVGIAFKEQYDGVVITKADLDKFLENDTPVRMKINQVIEQSKQNSKDAIAQSIVNEELSLYLANGTYKVYGAKMNQKKDLYNAGFEFKETDSELHTKNFTMSKEDFEKTFSPQVIEYVDKFNKKKNYHKQLNESPINTTNVSRVLLPRKPEKIRVNGKEEQPEWDESSKTLLLSFENDPAGVNVSIEW